MSETTRRSVLAGAAGVGAAAVLAACGSTGTGTSGDQAADTGAVAKTSDIPVGGGKVFKDRGVVLTQPTAGDFKAFSSVCTHQGCPVHDVNDGTINCDCHGSRYRIADGSVKVAGAGGSPAQQKPLPGKTVTITDGQIFVS